MPKNEYICDCGVVHTERVERAKAQMPSDEVFSKLSDFYKILGDRTRCKIISALQGGEMCVCDLANALSMTKSSVSHQLSKMRECGIVKCRKEGKEVYYSLDDGHVAAIFTITIDHIKHKSEVNL